MGVAGFGGFPVESLGARFKQERERKGIALEEVAVSTKIGMRMLQALEEGRYDRLPGGIFNKGFVRAYARHLGIDEEQAIADYIAATGPPPVEAQPAAVMEAIAAHAVETRGERLTLVDRIPWGKLAIFLLLVAIVLTIWGPRGQSSDKRKPESVPPSNPAAHGPASLPQSEEHTPRASIPAVPPARARSGSASAARALTSGSFSLRIQANQDSWLSVTSDGKEILQGVLPAHSQRSIAANHEIVVKAGNIGALDFWFNDEKLSSQGDFDQVKTVAFTPAGLR